MKPRAGTIRTRWGGGVGRVRKTLKWGGAAATVLLVVVWVGSARYYADWNNARDTHVALEAGRIVIGRDPYVRVFAALRDRPTESNVAYANGKYREARRHALLPHRLGSFTITWRFNHFMSNGAWWVWVPLWMIWMPVAAVTLLAWLTDIGNRRRSRRRRGFCAICGYDRAGIPADAVCPECGGAAAYPSQNSRSDSDGGATQ